MGNYKWVVALMLMLAQSAYLSAQAQVVRMLEKDNPDTLTITLEAGINYLDCSSKNLTWLDLSGATNLRSVDCSDNLLDSINVSMLTQIDELICCNNNLKALDVTFCTNLRYLDCSSNNLESLNVINNKNLQVLNCSDNNLTSIYTTPIENLRSFWAANNNLSTLDLFNNYNLKSLNVADNNLYALSFNPNSGIQDLWAEGNELTNLSIYDISCLHSLNASNNALSRIAWQNTQLASKIYLIDCNNNHLPYSSFLSPSIVTNYYGGLQRDVHPGFDGLMMNERIDISSFTTNASGERTATVDAYNALTNEVLVKGDKTKDFQYQIGLLRFWKEYESAYLVLTNSKFKSLEIRTTAFAVEDPEGIEEYESTQNAFSVIPGKGELTIHSGNEDKIVVNTLSGQIVCKKKLSPHGITRISLPKGIYIIKGNKYKVD